MNEIRQLIGAMKTDENALLLRRDAESQASGQQALLTFLIINLIAATILFIFTYRAARVTRERAGLLANEQTAHAAAEAAFNAEQKARAEAEQANRLKDEFLATVSHELRTPLTAIIGWSQMLHDGNLDDATSVRALQTIQRNAQSQAQLIEDLLDVSRIISGKLRLDVQSVELASIVEAALESVRPAADAKQIRLQVVLDPKASPVSGDPERLKQIVWNLVSNSIKFTPKNGRVQVRLERVNSHVEIIVSDTGDGISAEFLPHVFERFRQADAGATRIQGGLGLGLAIARHLTEMHGGTIHAESPGAGQGATFTVSLPLMVVRAVESSATVERVHPTAGTTSAPFDNLPALNGLRVLAVDDQADTLEMINMLLAGCGVEVQTATSVAAAMTVLEKWKPDLIVSDIGMPDEDGYMLISRIRALPPERGGAIPAVALTAYARVEDRMRVLSAGYQMHMSKPIEPAELVTVIASLAGRTEKI